MTILQRLIQPTDDLTPAAAQAILKMNFAESDQRRVSELAGKANEGALTAEEAAEYDDYITAGDWLAIWQSRARLALKRNPSAAQ